MRCFFIFFALLCTLSIYSQNTNHRQLDSLLSKLVKENLAMGSLAIIDHGKIRYKNSFGYSNILLRKRANQETRYRLGPLSRTYTTVIINQLIEAGKITAETSLADFFPQLPNASSINIQELLTQKSGLPSIRSVPSSPPSHREDAHSRKKQLLKKIEGLSPLFSPGKKTSYSNVNPFLLRLIAEKVTAQDFPELLRDYITTPHHLRRTRAGGKINFRNNEALSYHFTKHQWKRSTPQDASISLIQGQILATAKETARFYKALFTGQFLEETTLTALKEAAGKPGALFQKMKFHDKLVFSQSGTVNGFTAITAFLPLNKVSISLCVNAARIDINPLFQALLNVYFGYDFNFQAFLKKETRSR